MKIILLLLCLWLTGCQTRFAAEEVHIEFGVTPIFQVTQDNTGINKKDDNTLVADDGKTTVQILLFKWVSTGKKIVLGVVRSNPPVVTP